MIGRSASALRGRGRRDVHPRDSSMRADGRGRPSAAADAVLALTHQ